jgi:GDPmannose 4,6-dehydratase
MKKKVALITGGSGQDGSYLAELLLNKNYRVVIADRRSSRSDNWRHKFLSIEDKVIYEDFDLLDNESISRIFKKYIFDEVYNLAAQSFVQSSFSTPLYTSDVTAMGCLRILEIIRNLNYKVKFYQASSSEMIGNSHSKNYNENCHFSPQSPYAIAKVFAHHITQNYRNSFNIFACCGILFNHESPLRAEEFVTRKIIKSLVNIKCGKQKILKLGNIYSKRDWGHAKDYVVAMWKMLQQKKPKDYVVATGKSYSIKYFINLAAKELGMKIVWKGKGINEKGYAGNKIIIAIDRKYFRPTEVHSLLGDPKKVIKELRWKTSYNIISLVKEMINKEIEAQYKIL